MVRTFYGQNELPVNQTTLSAANISSVKALKGLTPTTPSDGKDVECQLCDTSTTT